MENQINCVLPFSDLDNLDLDNQQHRKIYNFGGLGSLFSFYPKIDEICEIIILIIKSCTSKISEIKKI